MPQSSYLLKAPEKQMAYWKMIAEQAGMSFAAWLREAADQHARVEEAADEPLRAQPVVSSQKVFRGPDPK